MSPEISWRYRVLRQRTFDFTWHFHPEYELTLITRGTGTRLVGRSIESYRPGDLTLIGSAVPHAYVSTSGTTDHEAVLVQFDRDFLGPDFFGRPEFASVARLLDGPAVATHFEATRAVVDRCRSLAGLAPADQTLALVRLLVELAVDEQARPLAGEGPFDGLSRLARDRIDAVCAYLQAAFTGDVRLAEVARVAHLSPAACSRFFRRALGRTITEYVTELRVATACQLLRDPELPIAEIATRCGYANLSNFNRRFRSLEGRTPREYRRAMADAQRPRA